MKFSLTTKSSNRKTGPIPVSTSPFSTCPTSCVLKNKGCYAKYGPLSMHWGKVSKGNGITWKQFLKSIKSLPSNQFWRHNQCGDLIGDGKTLNINALKELVEANKGKSGFTYTHYTNSSNRKYIKWANQNGFTINLSADSLDQADKLIASKAGPVSVIVSSDCNKSFKTKAGNTVLICPATLKDTTCDKCRLCSKSSRKSIIGFPAHGIKKKTVNLLCSK